jgi:hypothetical protein
LEKLLHALGAALVIQPEEALKADTSPDEAGRILAGMAGHSS